MNVLFVAVKSLSEAMLKLKKQKLKEKHSNSPKSTHKTKAKFKGSTKGTLGKANNDPAAKNKKSSNTQRPRSDSSKGSKTHPKREVESSSRSPLPLKKQRQNQKPNFTLVCRDIIRQD